MVLYISRFLFSFHLFAFVQIVLTIIYRKIVLHILNRDQNVLQHHHTAETTENQTINYNINRTVINDHNNHHQSVKGEDLGLVIYNSTRYRASTTKAVRMIVTIVICFFVCWSPIQFFFFFAWIFNSNDYSNFDSDYAITTTPGTEQQQQLQSSPSSSTNFVSQLYVWAFFTFHFLAMAHSIVNPIIYCFMCRNFQVLV